MASKSKVKKLVKGHNSQKAHLHHLREVCMQSENNPANGYLDIIQKQNTDARPDMLLTISPALLRSLAGEKID